MSSQPTQPQHSHLELVSSAAEASGDKIELGDYIASELVSAACSELSDDYWDDLVLHDKCGTFNDVCNSSLFADLSFSTECLVEDCTSAQLLACSNELFTDIHQVGMANDQVAMANDHLFDQVQMANDQVGMANDEVAVANIHSFDQIQMANDQVAMANNHSFDQVQMANDHPFDQVQMANDQVGMANDEVAVANIHSFDQVQMANDQVAMANNHSFDQVGMANDQVAMANDHSFDQVQIANDQVAVANNHSFDQVGVANDHSFEHIQMASDQVAMANDHSFDQVQMAADQVRIADDGSQYTSKYVGNVDVASCVLAEMSADALPVVSAAADGQSFSCQQSVSLCSQTNADNINSFASVDCKHVCKRSAVIAATASISSRRHQRMYASASNSQPGDQLTTDTQHTANDRCHCSTLTSDNERIADSEQKSQSVLRLDVNDNELMKVIATDSVDSTELIIPGSYTQVAQENIQQASCDSASSVDIDVVAENSVSTATRKRSPSEEFSSCKRYRAEGACLSPDWLRTLDGSTGVRQNVTDIIDCSQSSVLSAAGHLTNCNEDLCESYSDELQKINCNEDLRESYCNELQKVNCNEDLHEPYCDESQKVCCTCCKSLCVSSSLSYCTDGHPCCLTCIQHQVKRLLSAPSKA